MSNDLRVLMTPHIDDIKGESGINRVIEAYFKYLPGFGIRLVGDGESYDLHAVHAGMTGANADVAHLHGLYWSADYEAAQWEWYSNSLIVAALRGARRVTVPSMWVAETIQRDLRFTPHVIGHGIDWEDWQHSEPMAEYVLWNKNRIGDVCDPTPLEALSAAFPKQLFVSTFAPKGISRRNIKAIGLQPHDEMKRRVQSAMVYLATVKETFGIGILEAMASGVPVLGYAHGGIVDLIEHGVNGYLAQPGDTQDLADGLDYCIKHREALGANGREMARRYTWNTACEAVANVYRLAVQREEPTVSIVIPSYNYAEKVGRAIESALAQTYDKVVSVVVVDDGSDDDGATERAVKVFSERDSRVRYIRQSNGGVATARNRGVTESKSKYICCIDADDAIDPRFIGVCVDALERDNQLGIAYTSLHYTTPDGREGTSPWPGKFNYDKQLRKQNQIPTCCVFKREMWTRLGGYKQRYAPGGAGAEDAEFWLRAGAYGYKAIKATEEPLFLYSWQSGRVSGNKDYKEVDWLAWHPWVQDGLHPIASVATPTNNLSHPVRQYDEPLVSVVIPVGPGHVDKVVNALDSLESQTERKWECIIADDSGGECTELLTAYPYIRLVHCGTGTGAGRARNVGAAEARGNFMLFLDADDWLYPQAIQKMVRAYYEHRAAVYTDYVGKAFINDPSQLAPDLQGSIYYHNQETKETVVGYKAADYDCETAIAQPQGSRPYLWCNITTLFPRHWHDEIGGFDESMRSWEDIDYWYRMARAGKCFYRLPEELLVYNFCTGGRRQHGLESHKDLIRYLTEKYKGIEAMGCNSCSGKRAPLPTSVARSGAAQQAGDGTELVLVEYVSRNRGAHPIIGPMSRKRYAYAGGGIRFMCEMRDVSAAPHKFRIIEQAPRQEPQAPPPPQAQPRGVHSAMVAPKPQTLSAPPAPKPSKNGGIDLQTIPGISGALAADLRADDVATVDDILALGEDGLRKYKGVGEKRAAMILGAIQSMAGSHA